MLMTIAQYVHVQKSSSDFATDYRAGAGLLGMGKMTFFRSENTGWGICFLAPAAFLLTSSFTSVKMESKSTPLAKRKKEHC